MSVTEKQAWIGDAGINPIVYGAMWKSDSDTSPDEGLWNSPKR